MTFQNFQTLFIENDVTWKNKDNVIIYTIRTSTERDLIEQVTKKNLIKALTLIRQIGKIHFACLLQ